MQKPHQRQNKRLDTNRRKQLLHQQTERRIFVREAKKSNTHHNGAAISIAYFNKRQNPSGRKHNSYCHKQRTILTICDGAFKDAAADYEDKQDRRSSHCRKSSANYESKLGCFISKRRRRKIKPLLHSVEAQHLISAEVRLH
jgi:cation transport regulator ChaB